MTSGSAQTLPPGKAWPQGCCMTVSQADQGIRPVRREPEVRPERFRQVLGHFASGLVVITGSTPTGPVGMSCQSFFSVSLDPPLIAVCPSRTSATWPSLQRSGRFCVNILGRDQAELCHRFSLSGTDKFAGHRWAPSEHVFAPILEDCVAWIECDIEAVYDAGDHLLVLGRVIDLDAAGGEPLLFHQGRYGFFQAGEQR
jgi:3-hydroxy-9,10-secoandrosta-1,3,5(10)-triene-9,17-dione monooxygenase reductase component